MPHPNGVRCPAAAGACLFLMAICAALPARADTSEQRGKRVVEDAVAALGGDRFLNMQSRVEAGRAYAFYRGRLSGLDIARIVTHYLPGVADSAHALAVEEREYFGKKEDSSTLFTPQEGWNINFHGAQPLTAEQFARYKETTLRNIFYILRIRLHEPGMIFESRGADVLDNRPVEIVDITDVDNRTTTVYFDQTTKLPVRQVFYRRNPDTKDRDEETTAFSKYREVDGIQWPFAIHRERNGEKIYEMFSESVDINKPVAASDFLLPSGIKLMKP